MDEKNKSVPTLTERERIERLETFRKHALIVSAVQSLVILSLVWRVAGLITTMDMVIDFLHGVSNIQHGFVYILKELQFLLLSLMTRS